jgi:hypothetical protein
MQSGLPLLPFPLWRSIVFSSVGLTRGKFKRRLGAQGLCRLHQHALPMMRHSLLECTLAFSYWPLAGFQKPKIR